MWEKVHFTQFLAGKTTHENTHGPTMHAYQHIFFFLVRKYQLQRYFLAMGHIQCAFTSRHGHIIVSFHPLFGNPIKFLHSIRVRRLSYGNSVAPRTAVPPRTAPTTWPGMSSTPAAAHFLAKIGRAHV